MGKKKHMKHAASAPAADRHGDSDEDGRLPSVTGDDVYLNACRHVKTHVRLSNLRKNLPHAAVGCHGCGGDNADGGSSQKGKGGNKNKARGAPNQPLSVDGLCVCLTCANIGCDRKNPQQHALNHHSQSRHPIVLNLSTLVCWCYACDEEVDANISDDLQQAVQVVGQILKLPGHTSGKKNVVVSDPSISKKNKGRDKDAKTDSSNKEESSSCTGTLTEIGKVKGLVNLGNTCFFNSVMQCLARTALLLECMAGQQATNGNDTAGIEFKSALYAIKLEGRDVVKVNAPLEPLTAALRGFLFKMHDPTYRDVINPQNLFGQIAKKARRFQSFQQQDSHELLRYLLDHLRAEESKRRNAALAPLFEADSWDVDEVELKASQKAAEMEANRSSFVEYIFGGEYVSTVICKDCGKASRTREPFLDLSVPIPVEKSGLTLAGPPSNKPQELSKHQLKKAQKEARKGHRKHKSSMHMGPEESMEKKLSNHSEEDDSVADNWDAKSDNSEEDSLVDAMNKLSLGDGEYRTNNDLQQDENGQVRHDDTTVQQTNIVISMESLLDAMRDKLEPRDGGDDSGPESTGAVASSSILSFDSDEYSGSIAGDESSGYNSGSELSDLDESLEDSEAESEKSSSPTEEEVEYLDDESDDGDHKHSTLEDWSSLNLSNLSVLSCLSKLCAQEELSGENRYRCRNCNQMARLQGKNEDVYCDATKQLLIHRIPRIMTLHLKRFEQVGHGTSVRKVSKLVPFPEQINMAPFCSSHCRLPDGQPAQSNEAQYKLFGVVEHAGDLKGGHYTASVRISETNWVHTSDSHTRPTTLEKVLSSQAFLLFYELAPAPIV